MSREHLISAAVFPEKTVMVQGFPWCKDVPAEIGLSGLTAKILCVKHNNDLSPLDAAADRAADTLRAMHQLYEARKNLKPKIWNVKAFVLDGASLERWFLKTLINIGCDRKLPIGKDSRIAGRPSPRLVRIAYGQEKFEGKAGLYVVAKEGMRLTMQDRIQCLTLVGDKKCVEGAIFGFRGFGFLLYLEPEEPPQSFAGISFGGKDLGDLRLMFRDSSFITTIGKHKSHILKIKW
jgi:hypothetical protein